MLDEIVIQGGDFSLTGSGGYWYSAPGTISKIVAGQSVNIPGYYTIGINQSGIIYHRCFYEILPIVY
jgi:hypothetical protein